LSRKTVSEKLFERFCEENGIQYNQIKPPTTSHTQSPDYEIQTDTGTVIVEVKQFDPNKEDRRVAKQLQERGYSDAFGGEPGARVRLKIQSGVKQLKARSRGRFPTILVLYNNVPFNDRGIDPYEIKTAMYGLEKYDVAVDSPRSSVSVVDCGFGPKRKVTPSSNTSLSAVATLHGDPDSDLALVIYHNVHAARPLDWRCLLGPKIVHYTLEEKETRSFQDWRRLDV